MLFILGLYVTSNISLIRFLSYYISCGAIALILSWGYICIVHFAQLQLINNEWLVVEKSIFVYAGTLCNL
jgi:hypothetical protein